MTILLLPFLAGDLSGQWLTGYSYRKRVIINDTAVYGSIDLVNNPCLISLIDPDLKSVLSGGLIFSEDGCDIRFTEEDGTTLLDHELELYTDSSGELVAWVRIPVLSSLEDTEIYMYFGNPSASSETSSPTTWNNDFRGVWHLNENMEETSQFSNDGVNNGTSSANGKIGMARSFDGTDDYIRMETNDLYDNLAQGTIMAWAKWEGSDFEAIFGADSVPCEQPFEFAIKSGSAGSTFFLNESSTGTTIYEIGRSISYNPEVFNGSIDEVRVSAYPYNADWIKTSYSNQNDPAHFASVDTTGILNDLPCDAIFLTVSNDCSDSLHNNSGSKDSGIPLLACAGYSGGDVWFKVKVPPSGDLVVSLDTDPTPESPDSSDWLTRAGLALYSGTCGSLSRDTCWIDESGAEPFADPEISLAGYTPGDTIYLRVWGWNGQTGNFRICAREVDLSIFNLSGSGSYCAGSAGLDVIMEGSRTDRTYFLIKDGSISGPSVDGTGGPLTWSNQTEGVYRVISTGGPLPDMFMNGKVVITENPLPVLSAGYQHYKTITIESDSVSGTGILASFPVFISISNDTSLRSVLNGGHVQNAHGYDIAFTDGSFDPIPFEIIRYDSSLGSFEAWVSVPMLSGISDTQIQMLYGNPGISLDPSSHKTWGGEYLQVLHLDDDFTDASDKGNLGHNYKTVATSGKLDSARYFDGADNVITVYDDSTLDGSNDEATLSLWINFDNPADGDHQLVMSSANRYSDGDGFEWASQGNGNHFFYPRGDVNNNYNMISNPFSDGVWHYLAVTLDYATKEVKIYVDGEPQPLIFEGIPTFWTGLAEIDNWYWGGNPDRATRYFVGSMDEIRVQDVARTEVWLRTEYSNQAFPAEFITVSSENEFNPPEDVCESVSSFPLEEVYPQGGIYSGTGVSEGIFNPGLAGPGDHIIRYDYTDINGCFSSGEEVQTVLASPAPQISGNNNLCPNSVGETYRTPDVIGHSYNWVISGEGASITGGQGTNKITVDWGYESGTVRVRETISATGCDSTTVDFVVSIEDVTDPVISCPDDRTEYLDNNCEFIIPDYSSSASFYNNCETDPIITQSPLAGTIINGTGTMLGILLLADFGGGIKTECSFNVILQDTIFPGTVSLRDTMVIVKDGVYESFISIPSPGFIDNCGVQSVVNDFNGGSEASGDYPIGTTNVVYTATDINGNEARFTQQVTVQVENDPAFGLVIPEGFSPNEDGLNDRFEILGIGEYPDNELRVFNVHGIEVYSKMNYDGSWVGTSTSKLNAGRKLPTGTYYYTLYLDRQGTVVKGFVLLRRE